MTKKTEKNKQELNPKQEAFCQLYVQWDKDFFGNWVQCYIEVYDPDKSKGNWYKSACVSASQLLSNIKVTTRINELLEEWWLNDQFIDKQLLFLIQQHSDFSAKMSAIREYNKIKSRVIEKVEHSWEVTTKIVKIWQSLNG
jgi:hypothetical protein